MTLLAIFLGTLAAGLGSVLIAALLAFGLLSRYTQHMLSLAAGALLATSFMHMLPEAFESGASPQSLFLTLLLCVVFFFLLDKAELWHHGHEHHHPHGHGHDHHGHGYEHSFQGHGHGHSHEVAADGSGSTSGSWTVLLGDSVHAFGDGVLVAAAFMADLSLGFAAALAVLVHEVPHHIGDLVVLRQSSQQPRHAVIKLLFSGAVTVLGGGLGYVLIAGHESWLPYLLTVASGSYIYVALADLIPQLQRRLNAQATISQIVWLFVGMGLVTAATRSLH